MVYTYNIIRKDGSIKRVYSERGQ